MQDIAIQEIKTNPFASAISKPKPKKQTEDHILAEDEAVDQMVYYDKSSCLHAPKATNVPIF